MCPYLLAVKMLALAMKFSKIGPDLESVWPGDSNTVAGAGLSRQTSGVRVMNTRSLGAAQSTQLTIGGVHNLVMTLARVASHAKGMSGAGVSPGGVPTDPTC